VAAAFGGIFRFRLQQPVALGGLGGMRCQPVVKPAAITTGDVEALLRAANSGGQGGTLAWRFHRNSIHFALKLHAIHWNLSAVGPHAERE
jgi:hypothetical protein